MEFSGFDQDLNLGDEINVNLFQEGEFVDISSISKARVFKELLNDTNLVEWDKQRMVNTIG